MFLHDVPKPTREQLLQYARENRRSQVNPELIMWTHLRGSKLGYKFSRQIVIGTYIVDFCCRSRKVVVELDGRSHDETAGLDEIRDEYLRSARYEVIRIRYDDFLANEDKQIERVRAACESRPQFRY
jgi:very-short-patch-repair endonuclease